MEIGKFLACLDRDGDNVCVTGLCGTGDRRGLQRGSDGAASAVISMWRRDMTTHSSSDSHRRVAFCLIKFSVAET